MSLFRVRRKNAVSSLIEHFCAIKLVDESKVGKTDQFSGTKCIIIRLLIVGWIVRKRNYLKTCIAPHLAGAGRCVNVGNLLVQAIVFFVCIKIIPAEFYVCFSAWSFYYIFIWSATSHTLQMMSLLSSLLIFD